jgi:ligand-binding sensor domain-containing protein
MLNQDKSEELWFDAQSGQGRRSLVRCSIRTSQKIFGSMLDQDKSEDLWFDVRFSEHKDNN